MNRFAIFWAISAVSVALFFSCKEFYGTSPVAPEPGSTAETCQPPPLEKNIVGTWHFRSIYNLNNNVTTGTVTFTAQGDIIDPDSLFQNYFDRIGFAISKTYKFNVESTDPLYSNADLVVYVNTKAGPQITPFRLEANECKRIVLALSATQVGGTDFTLTR